jgi:hypothetical protein
VALTLFLTATAVALAGLWVVTRGRYVQGGLMLGLAVLLGPVGVSVLV